MALQGKCPNFGFCKKANDGEIIALVMGNSFICPECGSPLIEIRKRTKLKLFLGIALGLVVASVLTFTIYKLYKKNKTPTEKNTLSTSQSIVTSPLNPEPTVTEERAFNPDDFVWPELLGALESDQIDNILKQETDWVLLTLYYLDALNNQFSDQGDMAQFIDKQCFNHIYKPEMKAKLNASIWSVWLPNATKSAMKLISNGTLSHDELNKEYPYASKLYTKIIDEFSQGKAGTAFYVLDLKTIMEERARKDAWTLKNEYYCNKNGVTERIYNNAYKLVARYSNGQYN